MNAPNILLVVSDLDLVVRLGAAAVLVAAQTKTFPAEQGVDLAGEQQTKTKTALDLFADELQATAQKAS